jgi:hypothetical protein
MTERECKSVVVAVDQTQVAFVDEANNIVAEEMATVVLLVRGTKGAWSRWG